MKLISGLLGWLAKAVAWLLVKLGLWVTALYSLLFLIIAGITKTKLSSVSGIFWIGFAITVVFALVFAFLSAFKKFKKKNDFVSNNAVQQSSASTPVKKDKSEVNLVEGAPTQEPVIQQAPVVEQPQPTMYSQPVYPQQYQPNPNAYPQYQPYPQQQFQPYASPYSQPYSQSTQTTEFAPYINPSAPAPREEERSEFEGFTPQSDRGFSRFGDSVSDSYATQNGGFTRFTADEPREERAVFNPDETFMRTDRTRFTERMEEEQPMIFRTRMDPNLLIYEYSDRLDYYEKTPAGLVLRSSEKKKR